MHKKFGRSKAIGHGIKWLSIKRMTNESAAKKRKNKNANFFKSIAYIGLQNIPIKCLYK